MAIRKLRVSNIDHVVLHVTSMRRARKFYVDLLGMKVRFEGPGYAFLRCGGQLIGLFEVERGTRVRIGKELNHLAFGLHAGTGEEARAILEAAGVEVSGRAGDPDCIYFDDPDGHRLQLMPAD
jgi:catechol 2,3-dioxygenase-like lactoylglutathione lyase family enzyme